MMRTDLKTFCARLPGVLALVLSVGLVPAGGRGAGAAEDPFAANVRPTDPLPPAEQQRQFEVPEGFEVQLVAAEPDIHKPMNLAFDALGRLWVTTSREYPRPAPEDRPARDRLMIFEDFGPDGRARKVTEFAGGLNIPIGVYPYRSPGGDGRETWKAIVWSIPHVWRFEDLDGDGRADRRERLYGPFDHTRDTHGNQASFRRGFDGWLYATHGFNNDSRVSGRDGHAVHMHSGNTYRIRLDGSRIEHHTWGQVNPFGLAWDPEGNLYSSDCHSEPIYLLQAGGYYPSFGKPHDGLGFAPNMMEQIRGSTAIDGISYYADDLWPAAYQDSLLIGDVMTSRVYRDRAVPRGSGKVARPEPDFVISRDPWFRPVDTTLGPDGALYIADFYNRIIGHYEVPLDHPGRDRERGRIWRVVPRGVALRAPQIAQSREGLLEELASPSLPRRMLAMQDLADRFGHETVAALQRVVAQPRNAFQHVHALWLLERLGALGTPAWTAAARHSDALVRVHAFRILTERARASAASPDAGARGLDGDLAGQALAALSDPDPRVQRCAVEGLGWAPRFGQVPALLDLRRRVPAQDTHLRYAVRQALRNHLREDALFGRVLEMTWSQADLDALLDVTLAVRSEHAARFLLRHFDRVAADRGQAREAMAHLARYGDRAAIEALTDLASRHSGGDLDFQSDLCRSMLRGFAQRGVAPTDRFKAWGVALAESLLRSAAGTEGWANQPADGLTPGPNPWEYQRRPCADGQDAMLLSSHPRGESLTGMLVSRAFPAPTGMSFYLAGHDGPPGEPARRLNLVRLRAVESGRILAEAPAPRSDIARLVRWNLDGHAGEPVRLEVVDADAGGAYAWLAVGRLDPEIVPLPSLAPATGVSRQVAAAEFASALDAVSLRGPLGGLARNEAADLEARAAAARWALAGPRARGAADIVADAGQPFDWRTRLAGAAFADGDAALESLMALAWKEAPRRFQVRLAGLWMAGPEGAPDLIRRMREGTVPSGLLLDRALRERLLRAVEGEDRREGEALVAGLPDEDAGVARLLEARRTGFLRAQADPGRGREVFAAACAACHQIEGQGGTVGPQLTGIGTRGLERLCEDILAPNRNVDHAFWTTVLALKDGETVSGLFRREEGDLLILANAAGVEFQVRKADVAERRESNLSLMPSNYGEALTEEDFNHLLAYLLKARGAADPGSTTKSP